MNNIFNLKRFGLLLKRHWLEFGKIHLISLAIVTAIILSFYFFNYFNLSKQTDFALQFRDPLFIIFGILFITIAANQHFAPLGQKARAIIELTLPASTLEKFLVGIVFSVILAAVSYVTIFYLIDLAFVSKIQLTYHSTVTQTIMENGKPESITTISPVYYFKQQHFPDLLFAVYVVPFLISSIFLLGSIYFNKFHYVKTMLSLFVIAGLWITSIRNATDYLFADKVRISNDILNINEKDFMMILMSILFIVLTLIFWSITFIRLKEKEV